MSFQKIDWGNVRKLVAERKSLMPVLKSTSCDRWNNEVDEMGRSLIHYSCFGESDDALVELTKNHVCMDSLETAHWADNWAPIHIAVGYDNIETLKILCVAGANLKLLSGLGHTPFHIALVDGNFECMKFLIANGIRCRYEFKSLDFYIKSNQVLLDYERGVLRCIDVIIMLLGLKKRRQILHKLDRFLVKEVLAVEIWTTRTDEKWKE